MVRIIAGLSLLLLILLEPGPRGLATEPGTRVRGTVVIDGTPPAPRKWKLEAAMQRVSSEEEYVEETWLVGANRGLANCLVTLRAKDPAKRVAPKPLEKAIVDKVGVRYVPRVLVVTPGTEVVFRNRASPCRGFDLSARKPLLGNTASYNVAPGTQTKVALKGPDTCSLSCPVRPYARGTIHVVDTPHYAVTDSRGEFSMNGVPNGEYEISVWHEAVGKFTKDTGPVQISISEGNEHTVAFKLKMPVPERTGK